MSIGKKHIIRHYTIVEVMVAMGIFLIMMTIMMQFFTSAQKVWNLASKKNMLYADARVAMNLMTRELQSMLYNNDDDGSTGIYPFWYEWTDIAADGKTRTKVDEYFVSNKDLPENGSTGKPYLTILNFISTTDIKPTDEGSDVCEIRYKFVPVYFEGSTPYTLNSVKGGRLRRSCTAEYYNDNGTTKVTPSTSSDDYNFAQIPYKGASTSGTRVKDIWKTNTTAPDYETVITGVYSLRFTCFAWSSGLKSTDAMDDSGALKGTGAITGYDLATGTPKPVAVRIDMKLMDPKDLRKLAYNIYLAGTGTTSEKKAAEKQIKTLKQTMRTFSKVIYLGKAEN